MGSCQSTSTLDQRTDDNFGCYAMRQVKPFLWRGDLGINCGDLRRFGVICGDLRPIQLAVCFCCQILGGAQPQAPFSCREPKLGGHGPLSPLKTCFLVSSGVHIVGSNNPQIRNATPYSTNDAGKVYPSPCSPSSEDDSIIIERRSLSSVAEDVVIRG